MNFLKNIIILLYISYSIIGMIKWSGQGNYREKENPVPPHLLFDH